VVYLSALLFRYSYIILFWEFNFKKVPTRWHFVQYFIISCKSLYMFRA
jgi:hypothetical protein